MNCKTICGAVLLIVLSACAQTPASTPAPQSTIALTPAPMTPTASAVPTLKVKNNNLLFVEFFGIT